MQLKSVTRRQLFVPTLLFVMLTASACSKTTGIAAIEPIQGAQTFCDVAKPITWSSRDTPESIKEIKEHNAVYNGLCKGG